MMSIDEKLSMATEFLEHPQDSLVTGKLPVIVQCIVRNAIKTWLECSGKPREDTQREFSAKGTTRFETLTLFLKKRDFEAQKSKRLVCRCIAFSIENEKIASNRAIIKNAYIESEFQSEPMDETTYEGETVEMRCDPPRGEPTPSVYWLKDKREVDTVSDSSRYKLSNDYSLLIMASAKTDAGNYVCVATNTIEKRFSKPARLVILDVSSKYAWSEWSAWSACSTACGEGVMRRTRTCQTQDRLVRARNVSIVMCEGIGAAYEDQVCQLAICSDSVEKLPESDIGGHGSSGHTKSVFPIYTLTRHHNPKIQQQKIKISNQIDEYNPRKVLIEDSIDEYRIDLNATKTPISNTTSTKVTYSLLNDFSLNIDASTSNLIKYGASLVGLGLSVALMILFLTISIHCIRRIRLHRNPASNKRTAKRQRQRQLSELNLYYTCEKQQQEMPIFNYLKEESTTSNTSNSSTSTGNSTTNTPLSSTATYLNSNKFCNQVHRDELEVPPLDFLLKSKLIYSNNLLLVNSIKQQQKLTPLSVSSSSSSTLASSINNNNNNSKHQKSFRQQQLKVLHHPSMNTTATTNSPNYSYINSENQVISDLSIKTAANILEYHTKLIELEKINNMQDEETAYDIAENCLITVRDTINRYANALDSKMSINSNDVCIAQVDANGARLTLDCGLTMIVPEGAIASNTGSSVIMYLGLSRAESFKPKLVDSKYTYLSECITIGPANLTLLKPVILTMSNNVSKNLTDWNVSLFSAFNSYNSEPEWHELDTNLTGENNTNLNVFLGLAAEKNFLLVLEKLGRYCLVGEAAAKNSVGKYYRLAVFCSSSLANNEFNLRIYVIDDVLGALQEVLRDEKSIGGVLLQTSDSFLLPYSAAANENLAICVEELREEKFKCKMNVNCQDIPFNHIWTGRNHLLHCSFTLRTQVALSEKLACRISAYARIDDATEKVQMTTVSLNQNLENVFSKQFNSSKEFDDALEVGLQKWSMGRLLSWSQLIYPSNLPTGLKHRIRKDIREKICKLLDNENQTNWNSLAQMLEINRNMHYFASKASPSDMLLAYFEAFSELRESSFKEDFITRFLIPLITKEKKSNYHRV